MKLPLYREAIQDGLDMAFRHKLLWVYGLFAALLGQLGIMEMLANATMAGSTYALYPHWLALPKLVALAGVFSAGLPIEWSVWMLWVFGVLLAFGVLFVFLAVSSQGALIASAAASARKRGLPNADKAWHAGVEHFWRLFFINAIRKVAIIGLAVAVGWGTWNAAVADTTTGWDLFLFFALFILAVLVGMGVSMVAVYAAGYVVVEEYGVFSALSAGWKLLRGHWLVSLEAGCLILVLNAVLALIAAIGLFLFALLAQFWEYMAILTRQYLFFNVMFGLALVVFILFIMAIGSVFTVFTTTVWTHLFMKMHKHGLLSKLLHWLS